MSKVNCVNFTYYAIESFENSMERGDVIHSFLNLKTTAHVTCSWKRYNSVPVIICRQTDVIDN